MAEGPSAWRTVCLVSTGSPGEALKPGVEAALGGVQAVRAIEEASNGVCVTYDWRQMANANVVALLAAKGLGVSVTGTAPQLRLPSGEVDAAAEWQREFARIKHAQMRRMARDWGYTVHREMEESMKVMAEGDWPEVSNQLDRVYSMLYQVPGRPLTRLTAPSREEKEQVQRLLEFHKEAGGCWEVSSYWNGPFLTNYAMSILRSLPTGSVYFGGTDTGRFVIQGFQALAGREDAVALTQNCLADNYAMAYFRYLHGDKLILPSLDDSNAAFQEFVEGVKAGTYPSNGVRFVGGRVQVDGVEGVMTINGILVRKIFEANPDRAFFVEESYVIPWMNPHLGPHGFVLKLNRHPLASLPEDVVARDTAFWDEQVSGLMKDPLFTESDEPRTAIAKNRCAIAGLYAWRGMYELAEKAFGQALVLCPDMPEATYRLADCYIRQFKFNDARRLLAKYVMANPSQAKAAEYLDEVKRLAGFDPRRRELEGTLGGGGAVSNALELLDIYREMRLTNQLDSLAGAVITNPAVSASHVSDVVAIFRAAGRPVACIPALEARVLQTPDDVGVRVELAASYAQAGRRDEALDALEWAAKRGGDTVTKNLGEDGRFRALAKEERYLRLVGQQGAQQ